MRTTAGALFALAIAGLVGCADTTRTPLTPGMPPGPHRSETATTDVWSMADVEADFGGLFPYSLDTTRAGAGASSYVHPDVSTGDRTFCRDHFKALDLWWDGGNGLMSFHMDPPILFVGYRSGTFRSRRGLVFRRAVYETLQDTEATDRDGNVWRFRGRFNALCRGGEFEIGPLVFGGQIVVAQDPLDAPVLVRRSEGGDGCGNAQVYETDYSPYDDGSEVEVGGCRGAGGATGGEASGIQYGPGDYTGGETVSWQTGLGNGGTSVCGDAAVVEFICIDIYNEESGEWETWACGYATTC